MQTKQFFFRIFNINKIYRRLIRRNVILSAYNRATYVDQTCSQKFPLHVLFITRLNTFAHVWASAHVIPHLSWKGLLQAQCCCFIHWVTSNQLFTLFLYFFLFCLYQFFFHFRMLVLPRNGTKQKFTYQNKELGILLMTLQNYKAVYYFS